MFNKPTGKESECTVTKDTKWQFAWKYLSPLARKELINEYNDCVYSRRNFPQFAMLVIG